MLKETITLSKKELDRVPVIKATIDKRLRQREAAWQLGLSVRQVKRLVCRYHEAGARGLVSGHREKRSNNAMDPSVRPSVLSLIRERYGDFWAHLGLREAGGIAQATPFSQDPAPVAHRRGALAAQTTQPGAYPYNPNLAAPARASRSRSMTHKKTPPGATRRAVSREKAKRKKGNHRIPACRTSSIAMSNYLSLARRNPRPRRPSKRNERLPPFRCADRRFHEDSPQEPPRITRWLQSPLSQALPSTGAPP